MKKAFATAFIALSTTFAAHAQTQEKAAPLMASNDDKVVVVDNSPRTAFTENKGDNNDKENASPVREGGHTQASVIGSKQKIITMHVSGGNLDKYGQKAEYYANMFKKMFADEGRTDNPSDIAVTYKDSGEDRDTDVFFYINGVEFFSDSGYDAFSPDAAVKYIDVVADEYAATKPSATVSTENSPEVN